MNDMSGTSWIAVIFPSCNADTLEESGTVGGGEDCKRKCSKYREDDRISVLTISSTRFESRLPMCRRRTSGCGASNNASGERVTRVLEAYV